MAWEINPSVLICSWANRFTLTSNFRPWTKTILFQGRNTKIAVVLLQKGSPIPSTDVIAIERSANLTSKCDISPKMLFVLSHNEHLMGTRHCQSERKFQQIIFVCLRSQVASYDWNPRSLISPRHTTSKWPKRFDYIAINWQLRNFCSWKFVTNSNWVSSRKCDSIIVPHWSEWILRPILTTFFSSPVCSFCRHYSQAYVNLEEIRVVDTNCLEMKTVSGFLNYKMCKLMFRLNAPRDAITQFKSHIEKFKSRTGFKELIFEHYGWLSAQ